MRIVSLVLLWGMSWIASAQWELLSERSQVHFITTKNHHVSEIHHFGIVEGSLSEEGKLSVVIKLASVDTNVDLRNGRMRDKLFNVTIFKNAVVTADLSSDLLTLPAGTTEQIELEAMVSMMDTQHELPFVVQITKLKDGDILATSVTPVLVDARNFNLDAGVDKLRQMAGLEMISMVVPVTFNLMFKKTF